MTLENQERAREFLETIELIVSNHAHCFDDDERIKLYLGLGYILAYIDNTAEDDDD